MKRDAHTSSASSTVLTAPHTSSSVYGSACSERDGNLVSASVVMCELSSDGDEAAWASQPTEYEPKLHFDAPHTATRVGDGAAARHSARAEDRRAVSNAGGILLARKQCGVGAIHTDFPADVVPKPPG